MAGVSPLWRAVPSAARELLRSMLNHANLEILRRARPPRSTFDFARASVGNLFLTGARLFTGSVEAAIYLLALVGGLADPAQVVLPAVDSGFSHHVAAGLADGTVVTGQNAISHPSGPSAPPPSRGDGEGPGDPATPAADASDDELGDDAEPQPEDAHLPGTLPTLRTPNIHFTKPDPLSFAAATTSAAAPSSPAPSPTRRPPSAGGAAAPAEHALPAPIARIWYINPFGQEIRPRANPKAVAAVRGAAAVVYSVGSLYTSIVPSVVLRGIGAALAADVEGGGRPRRKVLVLNGSADRETGGMGAADYVAAIARAAEESRGWRAAKGEGGVGRALWRKYVTHVVHMEGTGVPRVAKRELAEAGVECVRCWGKRGADGIWRYDAQGLVGALDAALGKGRDGDLSRRNTIKS